MPYIQESQDFDTDDDNKDSIFGTEPHPDQQFDVKDENVSGDEEPPDVKPIIISLQPLPMRCKECVTITKQYKDVVLKQDEEIKTLRSELGKLKSILQKSKTDLKRANTVSNKRQRTIWQLRKRNERDLIKINNLNDVINLLADT